VSKSTFFFCKKINNQRKDDNKNRLLTVGFNLIHFNKITGEIVGETARIESDFNVLPKPIKP